MCFFAVHGDDTRRVVSGTGSLETVLEEQQKGRIEFMMVLPAFVVVVRWPVECLCTQLAGRAFGR